MAKSLEPDEDDQRAEDAAAEEPMKEGPTSCENGPTIAVPLALVYYANQGAGAMLRFTLYALAFGAVAVWRRSLVPTSLCHVGIDVLGAFKT